jgi:GrpB-like predicted nucleotidyltransferase (UPF0157 family)
MRDDEVELGLAQGLVRLTEPTSSWAELFHEEATCLNYSLRQFGAVVEHCGSTSIPGIPAKPILDILVGIPDPLEVAPCEKPLNQSAMSMPRGRGCPVTKSSAKVTQELTSSTWSLLEARHGSAALLLR